jgi:hypothetical protein
MYALLQLMAVLAVHFFYRGVLDDEAEDGTSSALAWLWVLFFTAAIFAQDEGLLLMPIFWLAALVAKGWRWFLQPKVLVVQVLLPIGGMVARIWLYQIRVPGEVISIAKDAYFSFPPAVANGLKEVAPFFMAWWVWPVTLFFLAGLAFLAHQATGHRPQETTLVSRAVHHVSHPSPPLFIAYVFLAIAASMIFAVNAPWQDDRYMFMVLPLFFMIAAWGVDRVVALLARHWPALRGEWATIALVLVVAAVGLPGSLSALDRFEPDYSAAYRWIESQLAADDLVATMRPAPAAVYLGRCDYLVAENEHQEFIMRLNGVWVDRWAGARVLESPQAFRDEVLHSGRRVWFVNDENRFESSAYSPEFVALILQQMDLVWHQGGVLVFQGQGYEPPPEMTVQRSLDANFGQQLRLTGYALSTDHPKPGQELTLQLHWQAIRPERNYTVFVHIVGADGQGLAQVDGEPLQGLYGMSTHWPRDRAVTDERRLTIPVDTSPGRYRLDVGLYDPNDPDGEPLPILASGERSLTLDYLKVDLSPLPETSQTAAPSTGNLGGRVRLLGYEPLLPTQLEMGTTLPLTLTWECLDTFDEDYTVFVHLAGPDGQPVAQADGQPLGGAYPTSFWDVGERLADSYLLEVPSDAPSGEYDLRVGMYLLDTGERLPLLGADGQVLGDSILLRRVTVSSP